MDYKRIRPSQIILDPENPRLPDGTSSDKEAVNRLLDDGYEQLLALARDLVEQGESNPSELPILLKQDRKFIVLEGNRRFAALKLLGDPKLADLAEHQAAFAKVRAKGQPPKDVYSVIADTREQADHWIMLRHTGANDGIGTKRWSAEQTATHRRRMKAPVDSGTLRSLAIADELTEAFQIDADLVATIQRVRTTKLTNIGRLFSADVMTRLHFDLKQASPTAAATLWARHTADDLHAFVVWAFDCLEEKSVDAFKNRDIRAELLNGADVPLPGAARLLPDAARLADRPYSGPDDTSAQSEDKDLAGDDEGTGASGGESGSGPNAGASGGSPGAGGNGTGGSGSSGGAGSTGSGNGRSRDQAPEKSIYSAVRVPNLPSPIQRLLKEARALPIEENYAAACVLVRVILELVVSSPDVLTWSGAQESDPLAKKIKACLRKLDPMIENPVKRTRKDLEQAFLETDTIGVRYMHQFMHNPSVAADPALARRFSTAYSPLLNAINSGVVTTP